MYIKINKFKESPRLNRLYQENFIIHDNLDKLEAKLRSVPKEYKLTKKEHELINQMNNLIDNEVCAFGVWEKLLTKILVECQFSDKILDVDTGTFVREETIIKEELKEANAILDDYIETQPTYIHVYNGSEKIKYKQKMLDFLLVFNLLLFGLELFEVWTKRNVSFSGEIKISNLQLIFGIFLTIVQLIIIMTNIRERNHIFLNSEFSEDLFSFLPFISIVFLSIPIMLLSVTGYIVFRKIKKAEENYQNQELSYLVNSALPDLRLEYSNLFYYDIPMSFWTHVHNATMIAKDSQKEDKDEMYSLLASNLNKMTDKMTAYEEALEILK